MVTKVLEVDVMEVRLIKDLRIREGDVIKTVLVYGIVDVDVCLLNTNKENHEDQVRILLVNKIN